MEIRHPVRLMKPEKQRIFVSTYLSFCRSFRGCSSSRGSVPEGQTGCNVKPRDLHCQIYVSGEFDYMSE
jgi:hypothetical protein